MTKNFSICFLTLVIALMLTLSDQVIVIGQNGINDLYGAVNSLGQNAGKAVIYLNGSVSLNQQVEIPSNISGLKSVTLASYTGSPVTVVMGGSVICANGIPLTVDQNVSLTNGFLVGGACNAQPGTVSGMAEG